MALWMVRAGKQGQHEDLALEKGVVVIGWEEMGDLSSVQSRQAMRELYEESYPDASKNKTSNHTGQLWSFRGRLQEGDMVALPLKTRSAVALGKVTGPYQYRPEHPSGARHTRSVEWIREDVPRSDFGQDLLYSLGAFMTVCQPKCDGAEERIKAMLGGGRDPNLTGRPEPSPAEIEDTDEENGEPPPDLEEHARDQIRATISARFKGHNLARLVTAILDAQGYQTSISPAGPDGGVDIVAGGGPMGFASPRICVQVKSYETPVSVNVLRELQGVMKRFGAERGLVVSWNGFKKSVYHEARTSFFEIRLWDADKLLQALFDHYDQLPEGIQAELPLKRIWAVVPEE